MKSSTDQLDQCIKWIYGVTHDHKTAIILYLGTTTNGHNIYYKTMTSYTCNNKRLQLSQKSKPK